MKSNKRQVEKGEEMKENSKNGNARTGFSNFYFKYTFFSFLPFQDSVPFVVTRILTEKRSLWSQ